MKSTVDELEEDTPNSKSQSWKGDKIKIKYRTSNSCASSGSPSPLGSVCWIGCLSCPCQVISLQPTSLFTSPPLTPWAINVTAQGDQKDGAEQGLHHIHAYLWRSRWQVKDLLKSENRWVFFLLQNGSHGYHTLSVDVSGSRLRGLAHEDGTGYYINKVFFSMFGAGSSVCKTLDSEAEGSWFKPQ